MQSKAKSLPDTIIDYFTVVGLSPAIKPSNVKATSTVYLDDLQLIAIPPDITKIYLTNTATEQYIDLSGSGSVFLKCSYQSERKRPPIVEISLHSISSTESTAITSTDDTVSVNISVYPETILPIEKTTPDRKEKTYIGLFNISDYLPSADNLVFRTLKP
eukprot:TRINITY_DN11961_c0_g2_i2.p4 TRINITY_DN11961_c0_g2~~TRINITY_DN11961_c0_g2_i2.p4  ORF type:complete len:160 (-),score=20.37 TRINITY_DN11961_c0_g2_i2:1562-2041(-)